MKTAELCVVPNAPVPTSRKGTAANAMLMALGPYPPCGPLPVDAPEGDGPDLAECYPAYATGGPILGDHMALFLTSQTLWPEDRSGISQ